jgi:hypothetical protein
MDGGDASRGSAKIPWAIGSLRTVKRLRLSVFSTPLSSRGIVTVRSGSTWVVDLACELAYQSSGNGVTRGLGSSVLDHQFVKISIRHGPSDQGRHTTIDLIEGKILEFGVCRGKGMTVHCSLESQKPKAREDRWHIPDVGATWMTGGITTVPRKR